MRKSVGAQYVLTFFGMMWEFAREIFPRRCAVIGITKVAFTFKLDANLLPRESGKMSSFKPGTGTVVGYVCEYETDGKDRPLGVYLDNSKFPSTGFLVITDDTGELVYVPLNVAVLTAKYSYSIKALHRRPGRLARVGDHSPPLVGLVGDVVRLVSDSPDVERVIDQISFTPAGTARYTLTMTKDEVGAENQRRKEEGQKRGRAWSRLFFSCANLGHFPRQEIVFIRKGEEATSTCISFPEFGFSD